MSSTVEDDYKIPIEELRAKCHGSTQVWIQNTICKVRLYFGLWILFFILSAVFIWTIILFRPEMEPIDKWIQRTGSLIVLLTGLGESVFVVKLRKLAQVSHWAELYCEIYIERRYRRYLIFSIVVSGLLVIMGSVIGGYGDIMYKSTFGS